MLLQVDDQSEFRAQLETRIRRFAAQRDELRKQLMEFNHALNSVEKRLETAVEMYRLEFEADPPVDAGTREKPQRVRTLGAESWNEAVAAVLRDASEPLHIKDIWKRVQERGFTTTAKDPLRAIASVLVRHPDAVRTAPNTYALLGENGSVPSGAQQALVAVDAGSAGNHQKERVDD
jgi:hypothetical protein